MTTLADLKTRIKAEMVRDDLADDLAAQLLIHIQAACRYYSKTKFWFNSLYATVDTVPGDETVSIPATFRRVDQVAIPAYLQNLQEVTIADLPLTLTSGIPQGYAYFNDTLWLTPTPNAVYTLGLTGLADIDPPSLDADSNIWTNEAQDLIVARTKMTLFRDQFRDAAGTQFAIAAVQEIYNDLIAETAKRLETPLRTRTSRRSYNIYVE